MVIAGKDDLRFHALRMDGVVEKGEGSYDFSRDGRFMLAPYPEKVHPRKPRVKRYDMFVMRVADADDKEVHLEGEPDIFFTTEHYNGYATVIVHLDEIGDELLAELVHEVWVATPLSTKLTYPV